jgi:glycosyltransferase involved in cell wall biosynthesis
LILFVGFPFRRKGIDILIEAFKRVAPRQPDWKLRILGWFPRPAALIEAVGGHRQIEICGPVEYEEMPAQLAECSILVLPSRSEAMGRILLESMAAGKARIGADVDGIPTVVAHGKDGLLFKAEDSEDLAMKLEMLMSDDELRRQLAIAARNRSVAEMTSDAYFSNTFEFYDAVIER